MNAGEVLAFDYRVLHRALDHHGKEIRPVLYCAVMYCTIMYTVLCQVLYYTFTKRWFSDAMNFAELPSLALADGKMLGDKGPFIMTSSLAADCLS